MDEEIEWKVLSVDWSEVDGDIVVWYYDVGMAMDLRMDEAGLMAAKARAVEGEEGDGEARDGLLEFSSVDEIKAWIAS